MYLQARAAAVVLLKAAGHRCLVAVAVSREGEAVLNTRRAVRRGCGSEVRSSECCG